MDAITEFRSRQRKLQGRTRQKAKGAPFSAITRESVVLDRHVSLHVTKGWRNESVKRIHARREIALWQERVALVRAANRKAA